MNARQEAFERLGGEFEVRVLEPSPPAVTSGPWFADDPVAVGEVPAGRRLVSPVATGDLRWIDVAAGDPELSTWAAERWLGPYKRLEPVPPDFTAGRLALHRIAETAISPPRERANGKIGLRWTRGGFGTPFFGEDRQLRVDGDELVEVHGDRDTRTRLDVDPAVSRFLGDWYGFTTSVLEELRAELGEEDRVQLWPEHFDVAFTVAGATTIGGSPGDEHHPEPYLYVLPFEPPPPAPEWNAIGFAGAELRYADLLAAEDQRAVAIEFLRSLLPARVA